jgi:hypothetical protein
VTDPVLDWLLRGDPAVCWQVERDLADRPQDRWTLTQSLIASQGWGKRLLDAQDPSGTWGGGLYGPKWISTTYTLLLLRRFGLDPANSQALAGVRRLLDDADWDEGGVSYWSGRVLAERCVNGMVLSIASWFDTDDSRIDDMARLLIGVRLPDGGWNCEDYRGATHSSMHTTISVLEGLLEWKRRRKSAEADEAIASGHAFLLAHRMFRSHRTGEVISKAWTRPAFPPRWHYDILRGLDHLRDAGAAPNLQAEEAIELIRAGARKGRWPLGPRYSGRVFFRLEEGPGGGRWNTLRALRVLRWWDAGRPT